MRHFCLIFWPQWKNNNSSTLNPEEQALSAISYTWTMRHEMRKKTKRINRHKSILCSEFDLPIVFLRLFVLNLKPIHLALKKVEKKHTTEKIATWNDQIVRKIPAREKNSKQQSTTPNSTLEMLSMNKKNTTKLGFYVLEKLSDIRWKPFPFVQASKTVSI